MYVHSSYPVVIGEQVTSKYSTVPVCTHDTGTYRKKNQIWTWFVPSEYWGVFYIVTVYVWVYSFCAEENTEPITPRSSHLSECEVWIFLLDFFIINRSKTVYVSHMLVWVQWTIKKTDIETWRVFSLRFCRFSDLHLLPFFVVNRILSLSHFG